MTIITKKLFEGPSLAYLFLAVCTLGSLGILLQGEFSQRSIRDLLNFTIRGAFLLFVFTFCISALHYFFRSGFTAWALRNRRYLGISFALFFVAHFLAIALHAWLYPDPFVSGLRPRRVINGGIMLGTVLLLALTSSDYVMRRTRFWLWKTVHFVGIYYIFYRFFKNYWSFSQYDSIYYIAVGLMLTALGLRWFRTLVFLCKKYLLSRNVHPEEVPV